MESKDKVNWNMKEISENTGIGITQVRRLTNIGVFKYFSVGGKKLFNAEIIKKQCKEWAERGTQIDKL